MSDTPPDETKIERPVKPLRFKSAAARTESWLSLITALGAVLTAHFSHIEGAASKIAAGVCVLLAAVYAIAHTPLTSSNRPGIKTKAFWGSIVVVLGSMAAALSEVSIEGLSPKITQAAALVVACVTAAGYNVWRYTAKVRKR